MVILHVLTGEDLELNEKGTKFSYERNFDHIADAIYLKLMHYFYESDNDNVDTCFKRKLIRRKLSAWFRATPNAE